MKFSKSAPIDSNGAKTDKSAKQIANSGARASSELNESAAA